MPDLRVRQTLAPGPIIFALRVVVQHAWRPAPRLGLVYSSIVGRRRIAEGRVRRRPIISGCLRFPPLLSLSNSLGVLQARLPSLS